MPNDPHIPLAHQDELDASLDLQTTILCWIAGLLVAGAAWLLAPILVPLALALTLAIALSPLARRVEQVGLGRTASSLICLLVVAAALLLTAGLLAYQAGTVLKESDQYLHRLSQLLADTTAAVGGDRVLSSLGAIPPADGDPPGPRGADSPEETRPATSSGAGAEAEQGGETSRPGAANHAAYWEHFLRNNLSLVGSWLARGIGGFMGLIGSTVICLSFVFYLLQTRSEWINRILRVLYYLGMRPRRDSLARIQGSITMFLGFVVLVSISGAVVVGTAAWLIGVPQPYLWGAIFGLLEFVPYFGPMVGGTLLTLVALTAGGGWWQPLTILGVILAWLTLEGYVITPMVYGRAVRFDPVMVLIAILFFGWLWGPLGMVTALPMMVLLRELSGMAPETPALDALLEPEKSGGLSTASHGS